MRDIGKFNKKIILSTGISTLKEISLAIESIILAGTHRSKINLLHRSSEYPAPFSGLNLLAIKTLAKEFNVNVGFSDHTEGIEASVAAVAIGANIIEKHFTLDKTFDGPDHSASLSVSELELLVKKIREMEIILGSSEKQITKSEEGNKIAARKSIVAKKNIKKGDILTEDLLTVKRPLDGVCASNWDNYIGIKASRNYKKNELIDKL